MPMGNIQKQKFQNWLEEHVPNHPVACALCGAKTWDFGEVIDTSGVSGVISPMAQLVCQTCGHVLLFDARKVGVM